MDLLRPFGTRNFVVGISIAALAYLLAPSLQKGARAVAVKGAQGAMMVGGAAASAVSTGREKVSGMWQNVSGSNVNQQESNMLQTMIEEMRAERQQHASLMQEMVNTMKNMQEEMAMLKNQHETVY